MKLVPKPEGFDLRDKRSTKASDASKWNPQDALYDASRSMQGKRIDSIVVIYRELHDDDTTTTHHRCSGDEGMAHKLVLSTLGRLMGWT